MKNYFNLIILALFAMLNSNASAVTVFSSNFNGTLAPELTAGSATLTDVQGYAGLGSSGNQFGGNFLRSATGNTVSVNLINLPEHDTISLKFLFAAIDSLDGTGTFPQGDFFKIVFDGNTLFSESFANATTGQTQSYVPNAGVELARRQDLGFTQGEFYFDSAYDLGADPRFSDFAHSSSTALIEFFIFGPGNQSLEDESWAMDNLEVSVSTIGRGGNLSPVPLPAALPLMAFAMGVFGIARSHYKSKVA